MIALNQVSMAYGTRVLFYDVNLNLNPGNAYALVGANGAGKSTLFRIITGEEEVSSGEVLMPVLVGLNKTNFAMKIHLLKISYCREKKPFGRLCKSVKLCLQTRIGMKPQAFVLLL